MIKKAIIYLVLVILVGSFAACSEYNRVLKSNDAELKFTKAEFYYLSGKYELCIPILQDLIPVFRGTSRFEKIYYYFGKSYYALGDYQTSADVFKNLVKTFPKSAYAEESGFLAAMCAYNRSPKLSLDQAETINAINDFQLYLNRFPQSTLKDSCNSLMIAMRIKLEKKSFENAKIYFKTQHYKSAIVALGNTIKEYPNTVYEEDILMMMLKSNYELAQNSVVSKKKERFEQTIKAYQQYIDKYAQSSKSREAESVYKNSVTQLEKINQNPQ